MLVRATGARVAVECKWTEAEFGRYSRTRLAPREHWYCDGSYMRQQGRGARCALTEQGQAYWEHLPEILEWNAHEDHVPCPFGETCQLARTVLAGQVREGGSREPEWEHAVVVYDERNPAFGPEGTAGRQYPKVWEGAAPEGALRRVAWQRVADRTRENELAYLPSVLRSRHCATSFLPLQCRPSRFRASIVCEQL